MLVLVQKYNKPYSMVLKMLVSFSGDFGLVDEYLSDKGDVRGLAWNKEEDQALN